MKSFFPFLYILLVSMELSSAAQSSPEGAGTWSPPSSLQSLPIVEELPNVFTFADGRKVETPDDWARRREELKALLLYYQYGSISPCPDRVTVVECNRRPHDSGLGTVEFGAADKAAIQRVKVPPCQLPDSGT